MTIPQTGSFTFMRRTTTARLKGSLTGVPRPKGVSPFDSSSGPMVAELRPEEVAEKLKQKSSRVLLLDVREPDERETAVIEPSIHIPMRDVPQRLSELPKDREIVVYCHGGTRSAMIAGFLEGHGYPDVANLSGGIDAWSRRIDPKVPRYG
jgi:rhodanese-related sulfurtransferase